ncbi:MAG: hypothetical protein HS111_23780 [Kofleriaceae bacterium]|nr:hypothetical protein [Kofleriaceae bacterium]
MRWVDVTVKQGLIDALRAGRAPRRRGAAICSGSGSAPRCRGTATPAPPALLDEDADRIRRFLRDEGFFEAIRSRSGSPRSAPDGMRAQVSATLGVAYQLGKIEPPNGSSGGADLAIPAAQLAALERRAGGASPTPASSPISTASSWRAQRFQRRGYPSARVIHDFDPLTSFVPRAPSVSTSGSRSTPRRKLDVVGEGNDKDAFPDDELGRQLTWRPAAGTADDVEVAASARALERAPGRRGHFDVAITSHRASASARSTASAHRIEAGQARAVREVAIVCRRHGHADAAPGRTRVLAAAGRAGGRPRHHPSPPPAACSAPRRYPPAIQLAADVAALQRYYQARGFAGPWPMSVARRPRPATPALPAVGTAQVLAEDRDRELAARFIIDEGPRTVIDRSGSSSRAAPPARRPRRRRGPAGGARPRPRPAIPTSPIASTTPPATRRLVLVVRPAIGPGSPCWNPAGARARPDSVIVTFNIEEPPGAAHRRGAGPRQLPHPISGWCATSWASAPARCSPATCSPPGRAAWRATNLFDAVDLDCRTSRTRAATPSTSWSGSRSAMSTARPASTSRPGGRPSRALFVRAALAPQLPAGRRPRRAPPSPSAHVPGGREHVAPAALAGAPDARPLAFDTEVGGFWRRQDTERFGSLVSAGTSLAASRTWDIARAPTTIMGRLVTAALRYDWRRRSRDEELVRPPGLAGDLSTNPVITAHRHHRPVPDLGPAPRRPRHRQPAGARGRPPPRGRRRLRQPVPVRPGHLHRAQRPGPGLLHPRPGSASTPATTRASRSTAPCSCPRSARFAGGDSTVRGFEEDRLATEIIEEPVPLLGQTTQIRALHRQCGIRQVLSPVDAQLTVWRLGGFDIASALFADAGLVTNTRPRSAAATSGRRRAARCAGSCPSARRRWVGRAPVQRGSASGMGGRLHFSIALRY